MTSYADRVRNYLSAIERGDLGALLACYAPDAEQIEWPNLLKPRGDRRGLAALERDFERGRALLSSQSYDIVAIAEAEDLAIAEMVWTGTLAVPLGRLEAGAAMQAHSAVAFKFRDGLIVSQRNYDCFEPF